MREQQRWAPSSESSVLLLDLRQHTGPSHIPHTASTLCCPQPWLSEDPSPTEHQQKPLWEKNLPFPLFTRSLGKPAFTLRPHCSESLPLTFL